MESTQEQRSHKRNRSTPSSRPWPWAMSAAAIVLGVLGTATTATLITLRGALACSAWRSRRCEPRQFLS